MRKASSRHAIRLTPVALALLGFTACVTAQTAGTSQATATLEQINVRSKYEREDLPVRAPGNKAASGARLGILGATSIVDAPVHVNAYTRELAEDWSAMTLQDVLENDSAVVFTTNKNHMLQNFNLRGLDMTAMDIATNGLYGIAPANSVPVEIFERIEVLRGPNVLLSGMPPLSSVAGTVNMVTKRALAQPIADLTLTYGTQSYFQGHADVGKRFGDEKRLGVRFNGVYGSGEMGAKGEDQSRRVGALAVDYLGDRARFSLDVYNSENKIDGGSPGMFNFLGNASIPGVGYLLAPPKGDTNMFRGTHGQYKNSGALARAEFDFTQDWQGYLAFGGSEAEGKGLLFGTRAFVTGADGTTRGAIYNVHTKSERRTAEAGVIGKVATGSVQHRLQLSANVLKHQEGSYNTACNYCYTTNMYNPVDPTFPTAPTFGKYTTENEYRSIAVADTMGFADDKVLLTIGGRHQTVKMPLSNYSESRFSPMVAAVVRPWGDHISLFGNYTEGLEPGQVVGVGYTNSGESMAPKQTKQMEVGVKLQTGALTHTVSAFEIKRPSFIGNNGAPLPTMVDDGEQRLRGLEWSMYGQVAQTVSLLGGITHIKSAQRNTGRDTFGTPEWRMRIGADWQTPVQGLKVGGRVVYTGEQWSDSGNRLRVPSWHRLDLNASYATQFGRTPVRFNASVENVTDKKYWSGTFGDGFVMAGAPRTFKVSTTVSF
ncbi:MAG: TonB-dependent siderophore receptor [Gammaproteobacteria bacterium]|nr:TonB-dependent siderophore receptor [Gammaproteobacteria bacterium]MBU1506599.1 TonB-dependent siderophore receptor [Gammaproteobacteria bacterium]MBU2121565.1 TonB-dependent siderophore receptor [Gammaproteobacteria bacterium]MBU2170413.1 TonB-dependent siderophore receptor [Gammaproteobacteria bacterium]MBU2199532.1 TonB-dependent siderophore receptor [Gammaproteobacteria bacterium]